MWCIKCMYVKYMYLMGSSSTQLAKLHTNCGGCTLEFLSVCGCSRLEQWDTDWEWHNQAGTRHSYGAWGWDYSYAATNPPTAERVSNRQGVSESSFKRNFKDAKTFTLHHIDTTQVSDSDDLKELIKEKLGGDVKGM